MLITATNLADLFRGFNTSFNRGFEGAETHKDTVAMTVPSTGEDETYGWLGEFPDLREWLGERVVRNLAAHGHTIKNRKFESTISIPRTKIEDDKYGIFSPIIQEMGRVTAEHPDSLLFSLLAAGFATKCYDGQYFFDADHPVGDDASDFPVTSVSNMQAGGGDAWYLLDLSRAIKPLIFQERIPAKFTALTRDEDNNVFWRDDYIYGVRGRSNAGFGLWQMAFASKAGLDVTNYKAARQAMRSLKGDTGRPLGLRPTHLIVPPSLEEEAMQLVNAELGAAGGTNVWHGTAELIITEWLVA